jgi:hypothetical protein
MHGVVVVVVVVDSGITPPIQEFVDTLWRMTARLQLCERKGQELNQTNAAGQQLGDAR